MLYTAHKTSLVQALAPVFEKETGIKTEVVQLGSGDVTRRVRAEAKAPKADVIWSTSGSLLTENADLLEPYKSKEAGEHRPALREEPGLDAIHGRDLRPHAEHAHDAGDRYAENPDRSGQPQMESQNRFRQGRQFRFRLPADDDGSDRLRGPGLEQVRRDRRRTSC